MAKQTILEDDDSQTKRDRNRRNTSSVDPQQALVAPQTETPQAPITPTQTTPLTDTRTAKQKEQSAAIQEQQKADMDALTQKYSHRYLYNKMFNQDGTIKDYSKDIAKYDNDISALQGKMEELNIQQNAEPFSGTDYDALRGDVQRQIDNLADQRDRLQKYQNDIDTVEQWAYYDFLKNSGDQKGLQDFEDLISAGDDSSLQRVWNMTKSGVARTASGIGSAINFARQKNEANINNARSNEELYEDWKNGLISDDDYLIGLQTKSIKNALDEQGVELNFNMLDPSNKSVEWAKNADKYFQMALQGTEGLGELALETYGGVLPFAMTLALTRLIGAPLGLSLTAAGDVALGVSGLAAFGDSARQAYEETGDLDTARKNGLLHAFQTVLAEKIGVDNFVSWMTNPSAFAGTGLLHFLAEQALAEGGEEVFEKGLDPLVDAWTTDKKIESLGQYIDEVWQDGNLIKEFIVGAAGGGAMALGGAAFSLVKPQYQIQTKADYNTASELIEYGKQVRQLLESYGLDTEKLDNTINNMQTLVSDYEAKKSLVTDAVSMSGDEGVAIPSLTEVETNLLNALQPDALATIKQAKEEDSAKAQEVINMTNTVLRNKGIDINAEEFLAMPNEERARYLDTADFMNDNNILGSVRELADLTDEQRDNVAKTNAIANRLKIQPIWNREILKSQKGDEYLAGAMINGQMVLNPFSEESELVTFVHELTHGTENTKAYKTLRKLVEDSYTGGVANDGTVLADVEAAKEYIKGQYDAFTDLNDEGVNKEFTAIRTQTELANPDFIKRLIKYNESLAYRIYNNIQAMASTDSKELIENAFMRAFKEAQRHMPLAGTPAYSIGTIFQAVDMTIDKNGDFVNAYIDGKRVEKITTDMVKNSPLGTLMNMAVISNNITREEADAQIQMYTDMCNLILNTKDPDLIWAITGSIGYQPVRDVSDPNFDERKSTNSSALTSNADKQYRWKFDVTTICNKTQQLINVMSETMKKLKKGLTEKQVVEIVYRETYNAGEPVPCPVCYVFSRWVGVGGLLNNIYNYQKEYANYDTKELKKRFDALSKQVDTLAKREDIRGTEAREKVMELLSAEYNNLKSIQDVSELTGRKLTAEEEARLNDLSEDMKILDRWAWFKKARLQPTYKPVLPEILFDLNKGEEFANDYPDTWDYRKTRGPAAGKAITPYTSEVLGQTILGISSNASSDAMRKLGKKRTSQYNPFLSVNISNNKQKIFNRALKNVKVQNLMGGSRAQSTSDFRFEYVLDYLLHFMELQALGCKGQTYTKVPEAVTLLASVGYEVNMSIMPEGKGWVETDENDPDATMLEDGKYYKLIFSNTTGMNVKDAFNLSSKFNNAQPIMVGVNKEHILLCMADSRITFIIPYHASGASEQRYRSLMAAVNETVNKGERTDFSKVQEDKFKENRTDEQIGLWDARVAILTGADLTDDQMKLISNHAILNNLYRRFRVEGVDPDCYGVKFSKDGAEKIYPYEYWDTTSTIDTADINGKLFVDYCESMGITPRFSEFSKYSGYWKLLIDRCMYNLDGSYHVQQAVNLDEFNTDYLFKNKMVEGIVQPSQQFDRTKTAGIVENVLGKINNPQYYAGITIGNGYSAGVTPAEISEYNTAYENNDVEKAQEIVNKVAKANGFTTRAYHGGAGGITTFNTNSGKWNAFGNGVYFTDQKGKADAYARKKYNGKVYNAWLKIDNPFRETQANIEKLLDHIGISLETIDNYDEVSGGYLYKINDYLSTHHMKNISDYIKEMGYDATIIDNGMTPTEIVVFDPSQIKSADPFTYDSEGNLIPIQDRFNTKTDDIRYSGGVNIKNPDAYERSVMQNTTLTDEERQVLIDNHRQGLAQNQKGVEKYGAIEQGENPVRDVEVARKTKKGKKATSRFARTTAESKTLNDAQAEDVVARAGLGEYDYRTTTNKETVRQAKKLLQSLGRKGSFKYLTTKKDTLENSAVNQTARMLLMKQMIADGEWGTEDYYKLNALTTGNYSLSGQTSQSARLWKNNTPDGQLFTIQSEIDRLTRNIQERYGTDFKIEISRDLMREFVKAKDQATRDRIAEEIAKEIAKQIPATIMEKLNAWRYLAMLFNPRTHIKNIASNELFSQLVYDAKRFVASSLEEVAQQAGWIDEREQGGYNPFSEQDRTLYKEMIEYFKAKYKEINYKFSDADAGKEFSGDEFQQMVQENRDIFNTKALEWARKNNSFALTKEDYWASSRVFAKEMVSRMKAKGVTSLEQLSPEEQEQMAETAYLEARKATFNNDNKLSNAINQFAKTNSLTKFVIDSMIPFKRTPMNLVARGVEYSPLGLLTTLTKGSLDLRAGRITANMFIDSLASGLTGSAIALLGYWLASKKIFKTKDDDPARKNAFDETNGEQKYSLDFGKFTYTIEWADPIIMPLAIGAEAYNKGMSVDDAIDVLATTIDPIFETSMLKGVMNSLTTYGQTPTERFANVAKNTAANYISQYVPTIGGAIARTIDGTRRKTSFKNDTFLEKVARQNIAKIPFLSKINEPYLDKYGNEVKNEDLNMGALGRLVLNTLSAGYYKTKDIDEYDEEMYRLYESTGDVNAFPSGETYNITQDGEKYKFTASQFTEFEKLRWKTEEELTRQFIDSDAYNNLTDTERVETLKKVRSYAQKVAKKDFLESLDVAYDDKELKTIDAVKKLGMDPFDYWSYQTEGGTTQQTKIEYLESTDLNEIQKELLWGTDKYKTSYQDAYDKMMK